MVGTFSITIKPAPLPKACDTAPFSAVAFPQKEQTNPVLRFASRLEFLITLDRVDRDDHSIVVTSEFRNHLQPNLIVKHAVNFVRALSFDDVLVLLPNIIKLTFDNLPGQNAMHDICCQKTVIIHCPARLVGNRQASAPN